MIRFALKDLVKNKRFTFLFVLNLSLGLLGLLQIETAKNIIEQSLNNRSKKILGADIGFSGRRDLSPKELKQIENTLPQPFEKSKTKTIYSMVAHHTRSRLAQVSLIQSNYPLYGEIELKPSRLFKDLKENEEVWMEPELALQLNAKLGDSIKIGQKTFVLGALIHDDSSGSGFSLAPKIYLDQYFEKDLALIKPGSTVRYQTLFKIKPEAWYEGLMKSLDDIFVEPGIHVQSHTRATEQIARTMNYFNGFLGLVSLVALFLALIGAGYLYRNHLSQRLKDIAILKTLGMKQNKIIQIYSLELILLGTLASLITLSLGFFLLNINESWVNEFFNLNAKAQVSFSKWAFILILGALSGLIIGFPFLLSIKKLKPKDLFSFQLSIRPVNFLTFF